MFASNFESKVSFLAEKSKCSVIIVNWNWKWCTLLDFDNAGCLTKMNVNLRPYPDARTQQKFKDKRILNAQLNACTDVQYFIGVVESTMVPKRFSPPVYEHISCKQNKISCWTSWENSDAHRQIANGTHDDRLQKLYPLRTFRTHTETSSNQNQVSWQA